MPVKKTTLVLGAGASCPYGFPTASELREIIIQKNAPKVSEAFRRMRAPTDKWYAVQAFLRTKYDLGLIQSLQEEFFRSQTTSIDEFVQNRPEFDSIARDLIAALFLYCETSSFLDGDWYQLFRRTLLANGPNHLGDRCSIITFNYERSLEYFLWKAIQHTFGLPEGTAYQHLQQLPIHHVYGSLGELRDGSRGEVIPWASTHFLKINQAADSLRLVPPRPGPAKQSIDRCIAQADFICFLGFGFWQDNFDLVASSIRDDCAVYASAVGLSQLIIDRVTGRFPEIKWGSSDARQCFLEWNLFR